MNDTCSSHSVLFVCLGNICRSPAAEGVLKHCLDQLGGGLQVNVDSAGTAGYHVGNLADSRMRAAAERRGIVLESRARKLTAEDLDAFDLVIAMDRENQADIRRLRDGASAEVMMLSDFLDNTWPDEVPDPYYGGEEGFELVLDMLEAASPRILAYFEEKIRR